VAHLRLRLRLIQRIQLLTGWSMAPSHPDMVLHRECLEALGGTLRTLPKVLRGPMPVGRIDVEEEAGPMHGLGASEQPD
jgi:hypothetical protein